MRLRVVAKAAGALFLAATFAAPTALVAAPARADETQEFYFFQFLDQKGISYGRKSDAVRSARSVCLKVSRPGNPGSIGYAIHQDLNKAMGLNDTDSELFIQASIYQYCPQVWHIK